MSATFKIKDSSDEEKHISTSEHRDTIVISLLQHCSYSEAHRKNSGQVFQRVHDQVYPIETQILQQPYSYWNICSNVAIQTSETSNAPKDQRTNLYVLQSIHEWYKEAKTHSFFSKAFSNSFVKRLFSPIFNTKMLNNNSFSSNIH